MTTSLEAPQRYQSELNYTDTEHVLDELTLRYGLQSSEIALAEQQAEAMLPHTRVVVRTPLSALGGIVYDGQLRTADETRTSNGLTAGADKNLDRLDEYVAIRQQFESGKLQWNDNEPRIVYGFLGYGDELGDTNIQAPTYGRIELKLRPELADRSTFTIGDSLMKTFDDYPPELLDRSNATLVQQAIELSRQQYGHSLNQIPYVEAQVRGGVNLQDIESASVTIKPRDLENTASVLSELHEQAPECKIIVNLDYTTSVMLPLEIIRSLPFVEFRPVVVSNNEPIFIQRQSMGYQNNGGSYQEQLYNEKRERLASLGSKLLKFYAEHDRPENFNDPILSHFRDGDRFPLKG